MEIIEQIGSYAGLAAIVGLAVLSALYFSQARDVKRLREWAGRAPERTAQPVQQRVVAQPQTGPGQPAAQPAPGAPQGPPAVPKPPQVPGVPAPAIAAAAGARPATAAAAAAGGTTAATAERPSGPGAATPAGQGKQGPGDQKPSDPAANGEKPPAAAPEASAATAAPGTPAPVTETPGTDAPEKPGDGAGGAKPPPPAVAPGSTEPATQAAPPAIPAPPARAATPAGQARPTPPTPPRFARTTPPTRPVSQPTAIITPGSSATAGSRTGGLGRGRIAALVVAGVLVIGGGAAFAVSQLTGSDEPSTSSGSSSASSDGESDGGNASQGGPAVDPSDVTVAILNGTLVPGLAAAIGDEAERLGFNVTTLGNASDQEQQRAESVVLYSGGHRREAVVVSRRLKIPQREQIDPDTQALAGDAGVVVVAGADKTP